ncbi:MAG: DNA polymerase III subunit alpha [Epulopiscium sp. Nele67-Bin005]|nr:MAG: DNA polymerase III subunit alpha [Epulopiscium sp. Nele67-Bin005]
MFTHLHVHTEYSLLDGSAKIGDLIDHAKALGMDSLAITDHGAMFGVIEFYKKAKEKGIKPILGCEVYLAKRTRHHKEKVDSRSYHMVLLAETNEGYENLMKMVSLGYTEGFYHRPRIDYELLEKYHHGIIGLGACIAGPVSRRIRDESYESARDEAIKLSNLFGKNNFFLEIQNHGMIEEKEVMEQTIKISKETNIPIVATNDVHYILAEDAQPHEILLCIQTGKTMDDPSRMVYEGGGFYLKSPQEMQQLFQNYPDVISNTVQIANRCNVTIEFGELKLPQFNIPNNLSPKDYFCELCQKGLEERYQHITPELEKRLKYEIDIIVQMGFIDYFLIVSDFIKYAKSQDIPVGPGRGSAAGSIVAYVLHITDIDPIKYQLLFERFLNPERISMPDIDIDFCYERRQEVIDYVIEKYGEERVAQIITFGTLGAKAVIRDVGRALNMPYPQVDAIAKMIPLELKMTINKALTMNNDLNKLYQSDTEVRHLIDMSIKLEGIPRHSSTHAAGVVIAKEPVVNYVPLNSNDGVITTQFSMTNLEELGLLKMDFLGLRTLTVISNAVKLVKENHGVEINFDSIEYNDPKVFELIASGNTEGIFQLESTGMRMFMKDLCPTHFEDIIAGISLYRPGPMEFISKYVAGKKDPNNISYTHQKLEPILKNTYGCIVYQEQVMQIVRDLGGYSLGRSDLLRRAMGKKKTDIMEKERDIFLNGDNETVEGAIKNGISAPIANKIFDEMVDFAKYAFNKSHAAAYAVIAYQTAYLKTYYKVEFMAALMTSVMDTTNKIQHYMESCKKQGIKIINPDINNGFAHFSTQGDKIRYGLAAIKNVGKSSIVHIVNEREENGPYLSLTDFYERISMREISKRGVENLILSGAFDSLGHKRSQYLAIYQTIAKSITINKKNNVEGQINLFELTPEDTQFAKQDNVPNIEEFPQKEILAYEKEILGVYLSGHPLDKVERDLKAFVTRQAIDFEFFEDEEARVKDREEVIIGGLVINRKLHFTKNNQKMAFLLIEDLSGTVECIVFPNLYEKFVQIAENEVLLIKGNVSYKEEQASSLIISQITTLENAKLQSILPNNDDKFLLLCLEKSKRTNEIMENLLNIFIRYKGNTKIVVQYLENNEKKPFPSKYNINLNDNIIHELVELLGKECIVLPKND